MIKINDRTFSGAVVKNDEAELIVSIVAEDNVSDICIAMNGAKTVTEIIDGNTNVIAVNTATHINASVKGIYTITFTKRLTVLEEMNQAIDSLLVMVLEGNNV